jgi:hypothetical protein
MDRLVVEVGKWWAAEAMHRRGGVLEVIIIGNGIDDITTVFSTGCPKFLDAPVYDSKNKWIRTLEAQLQNLSKELPSNGGSAIIEAIFRASHRLSELEGEKILIVYSDMREVNQDLNFEVSIPNEITVKDWVRQQHLSPPLQNIKVFVTGFLPYPPNPTTSKITPVQFDELQRVWVSLFQQWGAKINLTESLNILNLKGGDENNG